jgi:hypothetical protein
MAGIFRARPEWPRARPRGRLGADPETARPFGEKPVTYAAAAFGASRGELGFAGLTSEMKIS